MPEQIASLSLSAQAFDDGSFLVNITGKVPPNLTEQMMSVFTDIAAEVTSQKTVVAGVKLLLSSLHDRLTAALADNDPATMQAVLADLKADTADLATATAVNTVADPAAPVPVVAGSSTVAGATGGTTDPVISTDPVIGAPTVAGAAGTATPSQGAASRAPA